jgi:hypothetical protein
MAKRATSPTTGRRPRGAAAPKTRASAASGGLDPQMLRRVIVENVQPQVDCGRFPVKRVIGESVVVTADVHADGHDMVAAALRYRPSGEAEWRETAMEALGNDAWAAAFTVDELGHYEYTVEGWIDRFGSWRHELSKKFGAGQDVASELLEGAQLLAETHPQAEAIERAHRTIVNEAQDVGVRVAAALSEELARTMAAHPDRSRATRYDRVLSVLVEPVRARFGAWYEMFPRSAGTDPTRSATFDEAAARLPYVASMGFDVLYLPPIHPIGRSFRKGPNNTLTPGRTTPAAPGRSAARRAGTTRSNPASARSRTSTGSSRPPAATGSRSRSISPTRLAGPPLRQGAPRVVPAAARRHDQVRREPAEEVPGHLPDQLRVARLAGALDGAEAGDRVLDRPRREDLPGRQPAHQAVPLLGVGARRGPEAAPRRDLPVRGVHAPEGDEVPGQVGVLAVLHVLHLAEHEGRADRVLHRADADGRPRVHAAEPVRQHARHPARVPAARRAAGLPGPAGAGGDARRELRHLQRLRAGENVPVREGSEEYLDSEKYQIRVRDFDQPGSLAELIARINTIRREHPALHHDWGLRSTHRQPADLCYSKRSVDGPTPSSSSSTSTRSTCSTGSSSCRWPTGASGRRHVEVHDLLSLTNATSGAASGTTCGSIRSRPSPTSCTCSPRRLRRRLSPPFQRSERCPTLWYKDAVIYQAHVRGFYDSSNDGIGDFAGLTQKLDYLEGLGVNALWLLPFYPSPLKDDGYDIADYENIHPSYGTLQDFDTFIEEAHRRGLRVITELVVNHTSDQHPWFQAARRAPAGSPERDFYVWSDTNQKYQGVRIIFTDSEISNWSWDETAGAYYWHRFFHHQPDLNFDNPAVLEA